MNGKTWQKNGMNRTYYSPQQIAEETGHALTGADMSKKHLLKAILAGKYYEEDGNFFVKDVTGHMTEEFIAEAHALFTSTSKVSSTVQDTNQFSELVEEVEKDMFSISYDSPVYCGLTS